MKDRITNTRRPFSYHTLRGMVGLIALSIAAATAIIAGETLGSISASYHTQAQDLFVGWLFIVSAFLLAYRGSPNTPQRNWLEWGAAKAGALAVFCVALFPTKAARCPIDAPNCAAPDYVVQIAGAIGTTPADLHAIVAIVFFAALFLIMSIFAWRAWHKPDGACRAVVYALCCIGMLASTSLVLLHRNAMAPDFGGVYWAEFWALVSFGIGWLYSGVYEWLGLKGISAPCPGWLSGMQPAATRTP